MQRVILYFFLLIFSVSCTHQHRPDKQSVIPQLDRILDGWHQAAAIADEDVYFSTLHVEGVFLGTDPEEHWRRDEFREWASPYFKKNTAWAFTPYNRNWYFSKTASIAWFDELLETHMGICRGSGVFQQNETGEWELMHYNLALTLPNEKLDAYRKILSEKE